MKGRVIITLGNSAAFAIGLDCAQVVWGTSGSGRVSSKLKHGLGGNSTGG